MDQLAEDLEYILIDKAKIGSDILHRVNKSKPKSAMNMCVEVYNWFTETSGRGLAEQAAHLMDPKTAKKEKNITE